jgi:hypothetical protein
MILTPQEHNEFERLSPHIERALARSGGTHTLDDVREAIISHKAQLWWGNNSVIITEIETTPRKKILRFWLAGGEIEEIETMYPLIAEWGRSLGCDRAVIVGRKGWERSFLKEDGWRATQTVYEKELTHG